MKNRTRKDDDDDEKSRKEPKFFTKKKQKRLGGKGLSLEAFSNAKSKRSDYNPSLIKKQQEFHRNAKFISKFKKSQRRQSEPLNHPSQITMPLQEEIGDVGSHAKARNYKKKKNTLESARQEYEKKREEEEKARMEREALILAKKKEGENAESRRKDLKRKMFKRTQSGQPVMKYRIEHLLESIQASRS